MILDVPYLSQTKDLSREEWRTQGCAIACLAMVLRYLRPDDAALLDELFAEGLSINGQNAQKDWTHEAIARLARNHGLHAYAQEFRSLKNGAPSIHERQMVEEGIKKLLDSLAKGFPIIVSIPGKKEGGPHAALLVGEEGEGDERTLIFHDPDADSENDGESRKMPLPDFIVAWRKFAIFFEK